MRRTVLPFQTHPPWAIPLLATHTPKRSWMLLGIHCYQLKRLQTGGLAEEGHGGDAPPGAPDVMT